jgi:hypothetical protein
VAYWTRARYTSWGEVAIWRNFHLTLNLSNDKHHLQPSIIFFESAVLSVFGL